MLRAKADAARRKAAVFINPPRVPQPADASHIREIADVVRNWSAGELNWPSMYPGVGALPCQPIGCSWMGSDGASIVWGPSFWCVWSRHTFPSFVSLETRPVDARVIHCQARLCGDRQHMDQSSFARACVCLRFFCKPSWQRTARHVVMQCPSVPALPFPVCSFHQPFRCFTKYFARFNRYHMI